MCLPRSSPRNDALIRVDDSGDYDLRNSPESLREGELERMERLKSAPDAPRLNGCADRAQKLQLLFEQWMEEDLQLSDDEADRLRLALEQNAGLAFGTPRID